MLFRSGRANSPNRSNPSLSQVNRRPNRNEIKGSLKYVVESSIPKSFRAILADSANFLGTDPQLIQQDLEQIIADQVRAGLLKPHAGNRYTL